MGDAPDYDLDTFRTREDLDDYKPPRNRGRASKLERSVQRNEADIEPASDDDKKVVRNRKVDEIMGWRDNQYTETPRDEI